MRPTMTSGRRCRTTWPSWEGHHSAIAAKYPLQLISPHPRFSFHTHYDKHSAWLDDIPEHRVQKNGYAWWPARIHPDDAAARGIANGDIVKLYNDRATVLCIAVVTERVRRGRGAFLRVFREIRSDRARQPQFARSRRLRGDADTRPHDVENVAGLACKLVSHRGCASDGWTEMKKWNLIIDVAACTNCRNCTLAAKDEYVDNEWPGYCAAMPKTGPPLVRHPHEGARPSADARRRLPAGGLQSLRQRAVHQGRAGGAIRKREDGIVLIDPGQGRGQKHLVDACPYGQIWWNEERQIPQNWPFDAHLLDSGWTQTRAEQSCPTGAIKTAESRGPGNAAHSARGASSKCSRPELDTKPRLYYRNLSRYTKCFIGGTVSAMANGLVECVENASVKLLKCGATIAETTTDNYGDFKFDGLDENSGRIRLK